MRWINISIDILLFLFVVDCVLMCLVVLMQRSKQEGLGAAFGGGFTESVWGAQTSNVLVKATCILAAGFFIISIALAHLYSQRASLLDKGSVSPLQQELMKPGTPAATTATSTTTSAVTSTNAAPTAAAVSTPASSNAAPSQPVKPAK